MLLRKNSSAEPALASTHSSGAVLGPLCEIFKKSGVVAWKTLA